MRKQLSLLVFSVLAFIMVTGITGCGGGGGTVGSSPLKTVTSATVTCTPTTLQLVASGTQPTSQCTPTVNYSDGTSSVASSLVTLMVSPSTAGTISTAGLFTPSTSIASQTQVTVTATSTENTSKMGTVTITVNPAIKVAVSAQSATVVSGGTDQFTANVTNTSNTSIAWTTSAGTISSAGLLTAPTVTANTSVTVTATSMVDPTASGSATITVDQPPVAPTITGLPPNATVAFGGSANFPFATTGTPDPTVTCAVTAGTGAGTGACSVSGTTVSYTVPNPASAPASFVDTLTVTVQNSAGTASASVTINLVASITSAIVHGSVDPQALFCARYNCGVSVDIVGTGFFAGTTTFLQDLVAPVNGTVNAAFTVTDSSHVTMTALVGKWDYKPKPWHIGTRQPGPCCGFDSNVANFVLLGNLDTMDISTTDAFQLEQSTGTVQKFLLTTGGLDGSFGAGVPDFGLAIDDATGFIVISGPQVFGVFDPSGVGQPIGGTNGQASLAVAAKGGYMCGSQDQAGQIVSLQIVSGNSTLIPLIVGNTPWQTAMLTLNNQSACVVFNIGDLVFTAAPIPIPSVNPAPLWTLTVTGLTPLSQIPGVVVGGNIAPNGGWPLVASQTANKAAVLSRFDRKAAIIDLLAKTQMKIGSAQALTVDLAPSIGNAIILRMAVDNTHQKAVISLAQTAKETSTFISVDLNTGAVSPMNATTPFYATDLRVSQDGTTLYCGDSAGQFKEVSNN